MFRHRLQKLVPYFNKHVFLKEKSSKQIFFVDIPLFVAVVLVATWHSPNELAVQLTKRY